MFSKTLLALCVAASALLAADAGIGTWKLNLEKSKFSPGPVPQSSTMTYEQVGDKIKRSGETVTADGKTLSWGYTADYDGKDYPIEGNPNVDTIALKQVNDRTVEATLKKGGKVVTHARRVVSADGKTMTLTIKGLNDQGQKVDNVQVFDKQ